MIHDFTKVVAELNAKVRSELAAAAADGRFDELAHLTPFAKDIDELAARWPLQQSNRSQQNRTLQERPADELAAAALMQSDRKQAREFPKFVREGNELIKIGWSSQKLGSYEHRVPEQAVDGTCTAIAACGADGHRFRMDDISRAVSGKKEEESDIPSYQVYAVVSWLKWAGMIMQHGRQGYTVVRSKSFDTALESAWMALPQR